METRKRGHGREGDFILLGGLGIEMHFIESAITAGQPPREPAMAGVRRPGADGIDMTQHGEGTRGVQMIVQHGGATAPVPDDDDGSALWWVPALPGGDAASFDDTGEGLDDDAGPDHTLGFPGRRVEWSVETEQSSPCPEVGEHERMEGLDLEGHGSNRPADAGSLARGS